MAERVLQIPLGLATRTDVSRLVRELEALEDFLQAADIREPGTQPKLPRTSRLLDETLQINKLNALVTDDRLALLDYMRQMKTKAPLLHMSFSADPSPLFLKRLMTWLRQEIHPYLLIQTGLRPGLGAGCIVRTPNKYFDFGLKQRFASEQDLLIAKIRETHPGGS